jgi:cob(I)alamin adenosyltransferase
LGLSTGQSAVESAHDVSISTKTGDAGTTALLFNRRVPKSDPRVEACGSVDELNAALGLARATSNDPQSQARLLRIQQELVALMGELATHPDDRAGYRKSGFPRIRARRTARLGRWVQELEAQGTTFKGWAMPGGSLPGAAFDLARTACRRAERRVCALPGGGENPEIVRYLNRLSDLLWLMAREADSQAPLPPTGRHRKPRRGQGAEDKTS